MLSSARVVMVLTLVSRMTGLIRDMALAAAFGVSGVLDAFNYAFMIPNLFRRLFGEGALSAVFVPVFTQSLHQDGRESAWKLLGRVFALMATVLIGLTVVLELILLVIYMFWPGPGIRPLILSLTAVMLPFMIGICLLALFSSVLNCLGHFAAPAFAPVILNLCMIGGIFVLGPALGESSEQRLFGVALAVVAAGVLQLLFLWPVLRAHGVRVRWNLHLSDPRLRQIMRLLVPMSLASGALLISAWLDAQICVMMTANPGKGATFELLGRTIAYPLAEGAWTAVSFARRLHQFPLGVLAISLTTAAFPLFSQYAARGQMDRLAGSISGAVKIALFEAVPVGVIMIVLAKPIVALIFERGLFTAEDTARTARVLAFYGLGLWAFALHHVVLRGFYSIQDQLTPLRIGAGLVAVNFVLNLLLIWQPALREAAFALSTSITCSVAVILAMWLLRRRLKTGLDLRGILRSLLRVLVASAAAGAVAWCADWVLVRLATDHIGPGVLKLARGLGPLMIAVLVYLAAAWVLRMPELAMLLGRHGGRDDRSVNHAGQARDG